MDCLVRNQSPVFKSIKYKIVVFVEVYIFILILYLTDRDVLYQTKLCYMVVKSTISLQNGAQALSYLLQNDMSTQTGCVACFEVPVRVIAQTVSRSLSVDVKAKYKVKACGICGGQRSTTTGFYPQYCGLSLSVSFHCVPY